MNRLPEFGKQIKSLNISFFFVLDCFFFVAMASCAASKRRWRPPALEFQATLDKNFIGLESSLKVEISVSNLPLYNPFVGKKKKFAILE